MEQECFPVPPVKMSESEYFELWRQCGPIRIEMVEKIGTCKHSLGDTLFYKSPYAKPEGVCTALLHVLDLYAWRVALGFPSWEDDDRRVFRIHCPSRTGTVWEMRREDPEQDAGPNPDFAAASPG